MDYEYIPIIEGNIVKEIVKLGVANTSFKMIKEIRKLLIIILCLSTALPTTNSMPIDYNFDDDDSLTVADDAVTEKWVNPCGTQQIMPGESTTPTPFEHILPDIKLVIQTAMRQINKYKEQYAKDVMDTDYEKLVNESRDIYFGLPKHPLSEEEKEERPLDAFFKDTYLELQQIAVILEQLVIDMAIQGGEYLQDFVETEFQLRYILCNFHAALLERNVNPHPDPKRDPLAADFRSKVNSFRDLRGFLFLRDYYSYLQFVLKRTSV